MQLRFPATAALAASWGDELTPRIAEIVATDAALLRRLVMAPRAAHHALALWLHANPSADADKARAVLDSTPPKFLLNEIAGDGTRALFKALGKLERTKAYPARIYLRLCDLATSEIGSKLACVAKIDEPRIAALETLLAVGANDPLIRTLTPRLVDAGESRIRALADGVFLLRRLGLLTPNVERIMGKAKDVGTMFRMIARMLDDAALPGLGVAIPEGCKLRSIDTLSDLRKQGIEFRNCLRWDVDLLEAGLRGRKAFLRYMSGSDPILVALDVVRPGVEGGTAIVSIDQINGIANAAVDRQKSLEIKAAIEALGVRVVECGFDKLMRLAFAAARGEFSATDDDIDLDEDFIEELRLIDF